ncbi:MAG: PKD domain-containing protein, partial [Candidatus Nitrosocosmicus sp.]
NTNINTKTDQGKSNSKDVGDSNQKNKLIIDSKNTTFNIKDKNVPNKTNQAPNLLIKSPDKTNSGNITSGGGSSSIIISPYDSGYNHGCSDAKISKPENRYINQPGRGPSFHTPAFNQGYQTGFNSCSKHQPPIANAGQDKTVLEGQTIVLDGQKSYDPNGSIKKYAWSIVNSGGGSCSGIIDRLVDPTLSTPRYTAIGNLSPECRKTFELRVVDNNGQISAPDTVVITVKPATLSTKGVILSNIHTTPQNVHVNDKFSIDAKITNNLDIPISYGSADCRRNLLHFTFDKGIEYDSTVGYCSAVQQFTLGPNQSDNIGSGLVPFISRNEGQMNSQVVFYYTVDGKAELITKLFSFKVLPQKNNDTDNNSTLSSSMNDFKITSFGVENHNPFVIVQGQAGGTKGAIGADAIEAYLFYTDKGKFGAFSFDENSPYLSSKFTTKISKGGVNGETCVNINEPIGDVATSGHKLTITGINVNKVNNVQTVDIDTNPDQNGISNCIIKTWDSKP